LKELAKLKQIASPLFGFSNIFKGKFYLFIGFGTLILILIIFLSIKSLIKRKPKDSTKLKSLMEKEVYAENGNKIGKITEVYLENHRIYGWIIKPNKKMNLSIKVRDNLFKLKK
jgi:rRNA processing protein Gar1